METLRPDALEALRLLGALDEVVAAGRKSACIAAGWGGTDLNLSGIADISFCSFAVTVAEAGLQNVLRRAAAATGSVTFRPGAARSRIPGCRTVWVRIEAGRGLPPAEIVLTEDVACGLGEAVRLAWMVDAMMWGRGDRVALLSGFEAERTGPEAPPDAPRGVLRRAGLRLAARLAAAAGFDRALALRASGLATRLSPSGLLPVDCHLAGSRLPDLVVPRGRISDRMGRWGLLLVRHDERVRHEGEIARIASALALPVYRMPDLLDQHGFVGCKALYVRPDGIIGRQAGAGMPLRLEGVATAMGRAG